MDESAASANAAAIVIPIVFGIIFVLGVVGNTLVISVLSKTCQNRSKSLNTTNRFILNLAIADMLFLLFCVPFQAPIYTLSGWPFGSFMCVFCEVCQMIFMLASIYTMVALSLDRYFAIVYATSTKQFRTTTNANICLVGIWILSIGLGAAAARTRSQYTMEELEQLMKVLEFQVTTPPSPGMETWTKDEFFNSTESLANATSHDGYPAHDDNYALCIPTIDTKSFQKAYKVVIAVLGYVVPLLLIFLCYLGVIQAMTKNVKNVATLSNRVNQRRSQEAKKRVTKIVVLVVIFFAIHWFPYHVTELWLSYGDYEFTKASYALIIIAHCLSYANACVNPLIYAFMSKRIRGDLKKFFCCQFCSKTFVNMKICSKNFVTTYNVDMQKANPNAKSEYQETDKLTPGKKAEIKNGATATNRACQTVVYAKEDSCITCLTSLTPAPCHRGQCLSSSSSFNFNNLLPACSEDVSAEESDSNAQKEQRANEEYLAANVSDTKIIFRNHDLDFELEDTPEILLIKKPNLPANNGLFF